MAGGAVRRGRGDRPARRLPGVALADPSRAAQPAADLVVRAAGLELAPPRARDGLRRHARKRPALRVVQPGRPAFGRAAWRISDAPAEPEPRGAAAGERRRAPRRTRRSPRAG